jgi:hypothetical protein
MTLRWLNLLA